MFSDLECDFINPIDLCNKLNKFVIPEVAVHCVLTSIFFMTMSWSAFFWNVPLVAYNAWKISRRRHAFDATDIYRTLSSHKKEAFIKLGFYMLSFFFYLYRMILGLLGG